MFDYGIHDDTSLTLNFKLLGGSGVNDGDDIRDDPTTYTTDGSSDLSGTEERKEETKSESILATKKKIPPRYKCGCGQELPFDLNKDLLKSHNGSKKHSK